MSRRENISKETGRWGEQQAAEYLQKKGYKVVEQNFRYRRAEIDLIVRQDQLLVFVEVKTRQSIRYGFPETFVRSAQASLIVEAADHYLQERSWPGLIRFDIVAVTVAPDLRIHHFEDAFY